MGQGSGQPSATSAHTGLKKYEFNPETNFHVFSPSSNEHANEMSSHPSMMDCTIEHRSSNFVCFGSASG